MFDHVKPVYYRRFWTDWSGPSNESRLDYCTSHVCSGGEDGGDGHDIVPNHDNPVHQYTRIFKGDILSTVDGH